MRTVPESDLQAAAARGDADAFSQLLEGTLPTARRMARALLGEPADADDAVQEGCLSAWRAVRRYDPDRPFRPWFLRIVANAATDLRRRRRTRDAAPLEESLAGGGPSPERDTDRALLAGRLREALATLPERQRMAVELFDVEGYPHAEIAEILGVAEGTVRADVFHARRALRPHLAGYQQGGDA